ncbi:hypothetical protein TUM4438_40330 [Shewanella sairae]|uniref:UDP-3-O-(3-hydroxymyristoyl)glucosamine N-acyltransferase n=1 Tax=Shewanella sairae TaxID=190310 RepID=A0ABQ4PQB3_9GAMM|nr:DapH/DapD/GlmU-related protein [Shewanella sairae]MCL1129266.1 hypothetical protein [Shewanella sairae]GIU51274.1 hypothetical protein TUM4438_40330 [Shewanella sairae]
MIIFSEIIKFLEDSKTEYKVYGKQIDCINFGSMKKIIPNSLYYFSGKDLPCDITDSVVLVGKNLDTFDDTFDDTSINTYIIVAEPQLIFYKLMRSYHSPIAHNSSIGKHTQIAEEAIIGAHHNIGDFCKIGKAVIGQHCLIGTNVVVHDNVSIGDYSVIQDNTVIGAQGMAWVWDEQNQCKVIQPQIGGVVIESQVMVGSNVTIARGSVSEDTVIHQGAVIAHGSQIGHGVRVGKQVHISNNCTIAGNAQIGGHSFLGAGSVVVSHMRIAERVTIGAGAVINKSIETDSVTYIAMPARQIPSQMNLNGVPQQG